jgi:hypothetical protein
MTPRIDRDPQTPAARASDEAGEGQPGRAGIAR